MRSPVAGILNEILLHIGIAALLIAIAMTYSAYLAVAIVYLVFALVYASVRSVIKGVSTLANAVGDSLQQLRF